MREFSLSFSSPATSSQESESVAKVYNQTQHSNLVSDSMRRRIVRYDDSNAVSEYHTLDITDWIEIESHIIDSHRIGVGRDYGGIEPIIFVQIEEDGRTNKCLNFQMFHKKDWIEYRKERGENKNRRTKISNNGVVWVGDTTQAYKFRVFVPR